MAERRKETARKLGLTRSTGVAYYRRSLREYEQKDLPAAIADISEAIYNDPRYAEYYATRGLYYLENKEPDKANADLQHALELDRRLWIIHFGLGLLAFNAGNYNDAESYFGQALILGANRPEVLFYHAVTYHQLGDPIRAAAEIDAALAAMGTDHRNLKEAKAWKKEIDSKLPEDARPAPAPKKGRKKAGEGESA